jgi:23S rRNA pseudouridine1911/1915/1917 synthase
MPETLHFVVDKAGSRLDKYLTERCEGFSRTYIQKLIEDGYVMVNGHPAKASLRLSRGDRISLVLPPPAPVNLVAEDIPLMIVYQDADLLVIDKPAGIPVHPAPGHPHHTLVNALLAHCPDLAGINGSLRPGIVHRLDKDTSGLMIVAKNGSAHLNLTAQLRDRSVVKQYLVLVRGHLSPPQGAIEAPVGRDPRQRKRMAVTAAGREAYTRYKVEKYLGDYTLVKAVLKTGRTHQIRVHFSAIGYPVAGDAVYGVRVPFLRRQFVHACYLRFRSPSSGELMEFTSALPPDLRQAVEFLQSGISRLPRRGDDILNHSLKEDDENISHQ